jgi:hypothetical protein
VRKPRRALSNVRWCQNCYRMKINRNILAKVPVWQSFSGRSRLHVQHPASAAPASGFLLKAVSKANSEIEANRNGRAVRFLYRTSNTSNVNQDRQAFGARTWLYIHDGRRYFSIYES